MKVKKRLLNTFSVMDGSRNGLKSCYHDSAQIGGTYFPRDVFEITPSPNPFPHTYIHYSSGLNRNIYIYIYIELIVRVVFQDTDYVQYISFTTHLPMCSNVGDFFFWSPRKPLYWHSGNMNDGHIRSVSWFRPSKRNGRRKCYCSPATLQYTHIVYTL